MLLRSSRIVATRSVAVAVEQDFATRATGIGNIPNIHIAGVGKVVWWVRWVVLVKEVEVVVEAMEVDGDGGGGGWW